jgi:hypothetical protein
MKTYDQQENLSAAQDKKEKNPRISGTQTHQKRAKSPFF